MKLKLRLVTNNKIVPLKLNFRKLKNHTVSTMRAEESAIEVDWYLEPPPQKLNMFEQADYLKTVLFSIKSVMAAQYPLHEVEDWKELDNLLNN